MIIGLVGRKGSGKTTVAQYLGTKGYTEIVFAEPVKQIVSILFGFDYEVLKGDTPEKRIKRDTLKDPIWGKTAVEAMQYVGTELVRNNFDQEAWIKIAQRKIEAAIERGENVVISDVRFKNEIEFVRNMGGQIWVLYEHPEDLRISEEEGVKGHASENSFQSSILGSDIMIRNPKTGIRDFHYTIRHTLLNC